jgi:hypothetical protein
VRRLDVVVWARCGMVEKVATFMVVVSARIR